MQLHPAKDQFVGCPVQGMARALANVTRLCSAAHPLPPRLYSSYMPTIFQSPQARSSLTPSCQVLEPRSREYEYSRWRKSDCPASHAIIELQSQLKGFWLWKWLLVHNNTSRPLMPLPSSLPEPFLPPHTTPTTTSNLLHRLSPLPAAIISSHYFHQRRVVVHQGKPLSTR